MTDQVPFVDLAAQFREIADDLSPQLEEIFSTTAFVGGPALDAFEAEYADFVGVEHCIGVGNGTDAIELALRAVGVGAGDEVIVPANTFIATAEAVVRAGAVPVLVDVDPDYLLIDPQAVRDALTPRTRAVLPVHLYGQCAPVGDVLRAVEGRDVVLIEDAAQSQGATRHALAAGAMGHVNATSFYPGKNLGAAGDAGAVTTNDQDIARRIRLLANHGSERKYFHETVGFNSRLDTIQAAVLRLKLRRLPTWNDLRRQAAYRYETLLGDVEKVAAPATCPGNEHVWHLYVVRVQGRDAVASALRVDGIGTGVHYPVPLHLTGAFAGLGYSLGAFPVSEQASEEILSLPMFPHITAAQQERVVEALRRAIGA